MTRWSRRRQAGACRRARSLLQSFLDGQLEADLALVVARHLEACRRCGLELETYRALRGALTGLRPVPDEAALERLAAFVDGLAPSPH
ncbi:MAG TPA: zf-HC2 domain-containing protein [Nitriliruptorales bacterium]|nr:zf-HC2 domain-containing protein [Nitriliruptorales bacterium]